MPLLEGCWELFDVFGQSAEEVGEVFFFRGHEIEEVLNEIPVLIFRKANFLGEDGEACGFEEVGKFFQFGFGEFDGFFFIVREEGEKGFGKAGEVPLCDTGLVVVGVSALLIDGAKFFLGIKVVHEGAGSVVDGLAGEAHVVGVHDAVDEANTHPLGDEIGLAGDDVAEKVEGVFCVGEVTLVGVVDKGSKAFGVALCGEVLGGANAEVGACDAGEDSSFLRLFAEDEFAT